MSRIAFGTDGIRGTSGEWPIVPEVARRVGRAAVRIGARVVIGRDPRPDGAALAEAAAAGVVEAGGEAVDGGVVPTAALQVAIHAGVGDAGVMITASHNPEGDNGFKILGGGGRKPDDLLAERIEGWLAADATAAGPAGARRAAPEVGLEWREAVAARAGALDLLRGRRFAVDLANGAAAPARAWLEGLLPPGVVWLGTGGRVNDGCGTEHLGPLQQAVLASGLDGGFAVDGDADRCRLVDERGREVPGDAITWRLALGLGVDAVAVTVMSNGALERSLPGVRVVRTAVGDRHLREAMDAGGLRLAAEESGHVLFADHPGGDGVLCGLRTLVAAYAAADTLSDAFVGFAPLPRKLTRVAVRVRRPLEEVPAIAAERAEGLGALGPHGRVFLRYSGTEPVLRILVEGEPAGTVDEVSGRLTRACAEALGA